MTTGDREREGDSSDRGASSPMRWLVLVALAGSALLLYATSKYGPGVKGATGLDNLAAAQSLLEGRGFLDCRGLVYSLWPPFYPLLLAAMKLLGVEYMDTVRWSTVASFFFVILIPAAMVFKVSRSRALAVLCAVLLAGSPTLLNCYRMTRSEPLFMLLTLSSVWALDRYVEVSSRRRLAVLIFVSGMAGLQRYMGITLLIPVALLLLFLPREQGWKERWAKAAIYFGLAFLPLTCWMIRNWIVERTLTGIRWSASITFWQNMSDPWDTFWHWTVPIDLREDFGFLFYPWAALVLLFLAYRFFTAKYPELRTLLSYLTFPFAFYVGNIAFGTRIDIDPLLTRLMMPTFPFVVAFTLLAAHSMYRAAKRPALRRAVGAVLWFLAAVFAVEQGQLVKTNVSQWVEGGAGGFATDRWVASPIGAWLDQGDLPEGLIWSNTPEFVFLHTRRNSKYLHIGRQPHFAQRLQDEDIHATLVWITDNGLPKLKLDVLEQHLTVRELARFPDGVVYALTPLPL